MSVIITPKTSQFEWADWHRHSDNGRLALWLMPAFRPLPGRCWSALRAASFPSFLPYLFLLSLLSHGPLRILCSSNLHSDVQILSCLHLYVFLFTFPSSSRLLPVLKGGPLEAISKNNLEKAWLYVCFLFHGLLTLLLPWVEEHKWMRQT